MFPSMKPMNSNVSVRHLRAFLALVQTQHFTRAAQSIALSQSAFSAAIRALEQAMGATLFERDTRKVALTAAGEAFEGPARRALQELHSGLEGVRGLADHRHGRVTVAVLPSLAAGWLPPVLAAFTRRHPGLEVTVADVLSERGIELVRSGQADFGITTQAADVQGLDSQWFASDRFELVCRHDHRLAKAPRVTVKDLAGERFITQARHSIVGRYLTSVLRPGDAPTLMEVEQQATVIGLVRAGIGLAAIPQFNLHDFRYPDLVHRDLDFRGLERRLFIVQPAGRALGAAARAWLDWMMAHPPGGRSKPPVRRRPERRAGPASTAAAV
jgi:LysR family transcriptional regulator, carnitine catabolism transcriptional activator